MTDQKKAEMLRQIAEYYHISRNVDFAKFFGISEPLAFSRMKSGYLDYEEIYNRCPDISPDWLLSGGEGPMLRADRKDATVQGSGNGTGEDRETLRMALEALERTQVALDKSQEHISALLTALNGRQS